MQEGQSKLQTAEAKVLEISATLQNSDKEAAKMGLKSKEEEERLLGLLVKVILSY